MGSTSSRGFAIAVFIISAVLVGVLLACVIYFNRLRNGQTLTPGEATSMTVICAILFAITLGLFIWSLIALFISRDTREAAANVVTTKTTNFLGATSYGYTPQELGFAPGTKGGATVVTTTQRAPNGVAVMGNPAVAGTVTTVTQRAPPQPQATSTVTTTRQETRVTPPPFSLNGISADV
jgi:predicted permease